jgi:predicted Zn-dependent protease
MANIYYERVLQLAGKRLGSEDCFLGAGIAHELGHLLLRGLSHSSKGIMRAEWTVADLDAAASRRLMFSSSEAAMIREEIKRRALHNAGE